jgi:ribosomal protein L12E/L44/L45/RPP1/RPP2
VTENKVPVVADVAAGAEKTGDAKQNEMKVDEEKKEGSDDEDIEEEERSWRRGYDAE